VKKGSFQAMSSVWTMAERSTCRANRSAKLSSDAPRPSTATIRLAGETLPALNSTDEVLSRIARQGPAASSVGPARRHRSNEADVPAIVLCLG
jgi:hypothetical protein